jgi:hypothetical protein
MNETTSQMTSDVDARQVQSLGFWNRLTGAVVSASVVIFAIATIILGPPLFSDNPGLGYLLAWVRTYSFFVDVVILGVLAVGYPVERFWVRVNGRRWKAAVKQAAGIAAVLSIYFLAQLCISLIAKQTWISFWYLGSIIVAVMVFGSCTAFIGRLLYPTLVRFKRTMYISGAMLGLLALFPFAQSIYG